jgi:hypothetical protein
VLGGRELTAAPGRNTSASGPPCGAVGCRGALFGASSATAAKPLAGGNYRFRVTVADSTVTLRSTLANDGRELAACIRNAVERADTTDAAIAMPPDPAVDAAEPQA